MGFLTDIDAPGRRRDRQPCPSCEATAAGCRSVEWLAGRGWRLPFRRMVGGLAFAVGRMVPTWHRVCSRPGRGLHRTPSSTIDRRMPARIPPAYARTPWPST